MHNSQFSPAGALSLLVFGDTQLEVEGSHSWEVCKLGTMNLHLSNLERTSLLVQVKCTFSAGG